MPDIQKEILSSQVIPFPLTKAEPILNFFHQIEFDSQNFEGRFHHLLRLGLILLFSRVKTSHKSHLEQATYQDGRIYQRHTANVRYIVCPLVKPIRQRLHIDRGPVDDLN